MARKSVIERIESVKGKVNERYSLRASEMVELYSQSRDLFHVITNSFEYGYLQGMKATKAELKSDEVR